MIKKKTLAKLQRLIQNNGIDLEDEEETLKKKKRLEF